MGLDARSVACMQFVASLIRSMVCESLPLLLLLMLLLALVCVVVSVMMTL